VGSNLSCCSKTCSHTHLVPCRLDSISHTWIMHSDFEFADDAITLANANGTAVRLNWENRVQCVVVNGLGLPMGQFSVNVTTTKRQSKLSSEKSQPTSTSVGMPLSPPRGCVSNAIAVSLLYCTATRYHSC